MNVPLIVHLPKQTEGHVSETSVGQIDVMPTITDLLGVGLERTPHFGRSVFSDEPVLIPAGGFMPIGTYADDATLYVPGTSFEKGRAYDMRARRAEVSLRRASRIKWERMRQLVELSDEYVRSLPKRSDYDASNRYVLPN